MSINERLLGTMVDVQDDMSQLLEGQQVPVRHVSISFMGPQYLATTPGMFKPLTKRNICFIAMGIVLDDEDRVLLIQEAKKSCRGKWYPPAGRVEPGENIIDAVKREVKEEAGVEFEPDTFLSLKCCGLNWYRYSYIGRAVGGRLKTTAEQDEESLQAQWFPVQDVLASKMSLRYTDFFKALEKAVAYKKKSPGQRHPKYQIGIHPHHHLLHRVLLIRKGQDGSIQVLCESQNGLPCCYICPQDHSIMDSLVYILRDVFNYTPPDTAPLGDIRGLLTLEHCGIPTGQHDGICVTTVIELRPRIYKYTDKIMEKNFRWHTISNSDLLLKLKHRIDNPGMIIPLESK